MTEYIVIAAALVGAVGLLLGLFLGVASEKFKVEVDEKEAKVREALPGNNCGGCGYAGCDALAKAIAKGEAKINQCPVGGAPCAEKIAAIMGVDAGDDNDRKVAFVRCQGDCNTAKQLYSYSGIADCRDLSVVPNGSEKSCQYACAGYGTCVKVCQFDAIHIVNGVAVVDKEKCTGCGACSAICPKHIIDLVPAKKRTLVACSSHLKGKAVKDACTKGCIGCGICVKTCPFEGIEIIDNLAVMNDNCKDCGLCSKKCPTGAIEQLIKAKKKKSVKAEK